MFSRTEKLILLLLASINFSHIVDFMILMPLGPQLMRELKMTPAQFGVVISSYTLTAGIMGFFAAFFLDKFDRKKALVALCFGFALGTLLCAAATDFYFLAITRAVTGAFGGVLGSVVLAVIGDAISAEKRGTAMGIVMGSFSLASVLGVPFSLYLSNHYSWHAPFLFLGLIVMLITVSLILFFPSMREHLNRQGESPIKVVMQLLSQKQTAPLLVFMTLLVFGQFSVIPFLSPSLVANAGLLESQLPLIYLVGGICSIVSGPVFGNLCDRFGSRKVGYFGILFSLVPLYIVTHIGVMAVPILLALMGGFFVVMGGRMIPAMTIMTSAVPSQRRGSFMSLTNCVQQLAAALASAVAGMIVVQGTDGQLNNYGQVGWIAIGASLLAFLVLTRISLGHQNHA